MSVGLDIGSKTIKVVELNKSGNTYSLAGAGVVGHSGAGIEKLSEERDFVALADVIKKLFKSSGINKREVAVSLPEPLVFTRTIKLPLLTDQEVAAAIKWEAEQYIPIPVKDAIIQHQVLERNSSAGTNEVIVLLVAAPRALVEKYITLLNYAKLSVEAAETELISLARSVSPPNQTALLIDYGARSVNIAISKKGMLVFSRSIPTAGDALTRAISQTLGVTPAQAEEYKRVYGLSGSQLEGKIKVALEPILKGVIDEIRKAIHFYQTDEKGDAPSAAIISGGVAGTPELISYLTSTLGIEVLIANPFSRVAVAQNTWSVLAPYAPLYSIAVGLALR